MPPCPRSNLTTYSSQRNSPGSCPPHVARLGLVRRFTADSSAGKILVHSTPFASVAPTTLMTSRRRIASRAGPRQHQSAMQTIKSGNCDRRNGFQKSICTAEILRLHVRSGSCVTSNAGPHGAAYRLSQRQPILRPGAAPGAARAADRGLARGDAHREPMGSTRCGSQARQAGARPLSDRPADAVSSPARTHDHDLRPGRR
jgi:hypothetical protein